MPQAAAPPQDKDDQKASEKRAAEAALKEWTDLTERATSGDSPASRQIQRALTLEAQRAKLMKQISDNREYLRLMDRNEELNEDQAVFLDTFYPEKEKGERRSAEAIEATRKAREAARKNGA